MKRLAGETAIYGVSSIVGKFLNWMLVPMYTRVLATESDFGIVTNLYAWTALLMVILTYGMETGFFRFMNKKEIKLRCGYMRRRCSVWHSLPSCLWCLCSVR